jgi:D-serine deaminase-like pyridoxal phosphate-dependent protein
MFAVSAPLKNQTLGHLSKDQGSDSRGRPCTVLRVHYTHSLRLGHFATVDILIFSSYEDDVRLKTRGRRSTDLDADGAWIANVVSHNDGGTVLADVDSHISCSDDVIALDDRRSAPTCLDGNGLTRHRVRKELTRRIINDDHGKLATSSDRVQ